MSRKRRREEGGAGAIEKEPKHAEVETVAVVDWFQAVADNRLDLLMALKSEELKRLIELRDVKGNNSLMAATIYGHETMVAFLLDNGANPQVQNDEGKTPLDYAHEAGFHAITGRLVIALPEGDTNAPYIERNVRRSLTIFGVAVRESGSERVGSYGGPFF